MDRNRGPNANAAAEAIEAHIERIVIGARAIDVQLINTDDHLPGRIAIPWAPQPFRRKREAIAPSRDGPDDARPIRAEARARLVAAIAKARRWLDEIASDSAASIEAVAARESVSERSARMALTLAFLAPDIVEAAIEGTLPRGFGVSRLMDLPASWAAQRRAIGVAAPRR